jgi:hypothetical protein
MQDLNVVLIVLGVVVTFVYLWYNQAYRPREKGEGPARHSSFVGSDIPEPKNLFILQYEQISQRVRSREISTAVVGSLFLTVSVLLLCSVAILGERISTLFEYVLVFASVILYSIWLLGFNLPANIVSNRDLYQLRQMEKETEDGLTVHTSLWENMKDTAWSKYFKRQVWIYPFWVLVTVAVLVVHGILIF